MGPDGFQGHDVYLRTAISVDAAGWASYGKVKMPDYRWGIFLADGNTIVGVSHILLEDEDGERFSNIAEVFIDASYRGQKLCSMLVEETFNVLEEKNYSGGVIETVIAGGMPMLKCFLRVADTCVIASR